jgi:hypothetical protein
VGTDTSTSQAVNRQCADDFGNGGGNGIFFILQCYNGGLDCALVNRYWSNNRGVPQYACTTSTANGTNIYEDFPASSCTGAAYWQVYY